MNKEELILTYAASKYLKLQSKRLIGKLYDIVIPLLEKEEICDLEEFGEIKTYNLFPAHYEEYLIFLNDNDLELSRIHSKDKMALFLARIRSLPVLVFEKVERIVCDKLGIQTLTLGEIYEPPTLFSEKIS